MKLKLRKKYLKRSQVGQSPMRYRAIQPEGEGTTVHAVIIIDPVLRNRADLRKPMLKHEVDEIRHWGEGNHRHHAHAHAKRREPKHTRRLTVAGFWKEIKGRQK